MNGCDAKARSEVEIEQDQRPTTECSHKLFYRTCVNRILRER